MAKRPLAKTSINFVVIRPMPFRCVKVEPVYSMRPQKVTIWGQLASGTSENATNLFFPSKSLMPMDGDK